MAKMTASRFSLQEENFFKDVQDLVKYGCDNEEHLSTFLQRYINLLLQVDTEEDTLINFTKAALILEASAKIYGTKIDQLWVTLEHVLDSLKTNGNGNNNKKKEQNEEEVERDVAADYKEPVNKLPKVRRRKKLGAALSNPDEFVELDNISGLLAKSKNEPEVKCKSKMEFFKEVPNLFIKKKWEKKKNDLCLDHGQDDGDDSRLSNWMLTPENMLIKEANLSEYVNEFEENHVSMLDETSCIYEENELGNDSPNDDDDNNNSGRNETESMEIENLIYDRASDNNLNDVSGGDSEKLESEADNDKSCTNDREMIVEVSVNTQEFQIRKYPNIMCVDEHVVDVDDIASESTNLRDVNSVTKRMRVQRRKTIPFKLCVAKKARARSGRKRRVNPRNKSLDSSIPRILNASVSDPAFAVLPGECVIDDVRTLRFSNECQNILQEETAKPKVERNIDLAAKVTGWHESISERLKSLEQREPLDMDEVCCEIMSSLPKIDGDEPSFQALVENIKPASVTGLFYACLQLANEENIEIMRSDSTTQSDDEFSVKALRTFRYKQDLDNRNGDSSLCRRSDKSREFAQPSTSSCEKKRCCSWKSLSPERSLEPKRMKKTDLQVEEGDLNTPEYERDELMEKEEEASADPEEKTLSSDSDEEKIK